MTNTNIKNITSSPLSFLSSHLSLNKFTNSSASASAPTLPSSNSTEQTASTSLPTTNTQTGASSESLSKTVYDSLAPLNIPSKPLVYLEEKNDTETSLKKDSTITANSSEGDDSRLDEKAKLESILFSSMSHTSSTYKQNDGSSSSSSFSSNKTINRFGNNSTGANTMNTSSSWPRMPNMQRLPANYVCNICKKAGHPKSLCPEAGTIQRSEEPLKIAKGIPKSFQIPAEKGHKFAMMTADGSYVVSVIDHKAAQVVKKDKQIFLDEDEDDLNKAKQKGDDGANSSSVKIPSELKCPYGDHIMKDAVLVPCCGHFVCCDSCIREKISNDGIEEIECPYEGCEIGSLGSITPFHEIRKKVNEYLNEIKLANQRQVATANGATAKAQTVINSANSDPFFDLILNDVGEKSSTDDGKLSPNIYSIENKNEFDIETETRVDENEEMVSPVQDTKISSSEAQNSQEALNGAANLAKPTQSNSPLLPTPDISPQIVVQPLNVIQQPTNLTFSANTNTFNYSSTNHSFNYAQPNPNFHSYKARNGSLPFQNGNGSYINHPRPNMSMQQAQFSSNMQFMNRPAYNSHYQSRMSFDQQVFPNYMHNNHYNPNWQGAYPGLNQSQMSINQTQFSANMAPLANPSSVPTIGGVQQGAIFSGMNQVQTAGMAQSFQMNNSLMNPTGSSIMSEAEFYKYQEKLRKEREKG